MRLKGQNYAANLLHRWTLLYTVFLFGFFILYLPPTGYSSIVGPKHTLFVTGTCIFLAPIPFLAPYSKPRMDSLPFFLCLGLLGWLLISAIFSPYPQVAWTGSRRHEGFWTFALYLALFLVFALWNGEREWSRWAMGIASVFVFALAAVQFAGKNPLGLYPSDFTFHDRGLLYSGEYFSTIGNSDLLSGFLTMGFLYLAGTYAMAESRFRFLCLPAAGLLWMTLLLSEVSAGPVAILLTLALVLPLYLLIGENVGRVFDIGAVLLLGAAVKSIIGYSYEDRVLSFALRMGPLQAGLLMGAIAAYAGRLLPFPQGPKRKAAVILAAVYVIVFLVLFLFLFFYSGSNETLRGLHLLVRGNPPDTLGSSRIRIWKEALKLGMEKPLLGTGPDTYRFRSEIVFTTPGVGDTVRTTTVDAAHNEYLHLWVCCGLPAALLFLGLIGSVVVPVLAKPNAPRLRLLLPVLGYSIHAFFGISQSVVSPLFYVFLGMLAWTNYHSRR